MELVGCFCLIDFLIGRDVGVRVDFLQAIAQRVYLHFAYGAACCNQLSVAVGDAHSVAVHDGDVAYAASYESLGALLSYASDTED